MPYLVHTCSCACLDAPGSLDMVAALAIYLADRVMINDRVLGSVMLRPETSHCTLPMSLVLVFSEQQTALRGGAYSQTALAIASC